MTNCTGSAAWMAPEVFEGSSYQTIKTWHHSGDIWAVEPIPDQGTFLTCGEDNEFHEISIASKEVLRTGTIY